MAESGMRNLETPSGKGAGDENFPVGSFLIRPSLRGHVRTLYNFARAADDIADNPALEPDDKVARLARMSAIIAGGVQGNIAFAESPSALRMRESLMVTGVTPQHCLDLLKAFTQDATKSRYKDWDELLGYCSLSASPIGRHLLDLHGEGPACRPAADALCNALQIVNHLQDCGADYKALDRVYLPTDDLDAEGARIEDLARNKLTPALRRTLDRVILPLDDLIAQSADIARLVDDRRIALECQVIRGLCVRIRTMLKHQDPLANRVELSRSTKGAIVVGGVLRGLWRRRSRRASRVPALAL